MICACAHPLWGLNDGAVQQPFFNLDHNATAPMSKRALQAYTLGERLLAQGAKSAANLQRKLLARIIARIARALGAHADEVWLTSGGTEANALVLAATVLRARRASTRARVLTSMFEHPSISANIVRAQGLGFMEVQHLATSHQGQALVRPQPNFSGGVPHLVTVMHANNETGVLQDLSVVMDQYGGARTWRHSDAVQSLGRMPLCFANLPLDLMTVAGHKVGAGHGAGVLVVRRGCQFEVPPLFGPKADGSPGWTLPGGAHLPNAMALAAAIATTAQQANVEYQTVRSVRDAFEARLQVSCAPIVVLGQQVPRLCNTSCVRIVGCAAETMLMALDGLGLGVSIGSACSSGVVTPSATLRAMGLGETAAKEVLRISFPMQAPLLTLQHMADALLHALTDLTAALRA